MINLKNILSAVKIKNTKTWKINYLLKNFDRFLDDEKNIFLEKKFLTSHSWFFEDKNPTSQNFHKKIFYKKNFYLEKNFEIEYLYLDNFSSVTPSSSSIFPKKSEIKFLRTNEKNLEKFSKNFTTEIRSNFFFTEASFFYLLDENFETIWSYRISPKNFKIWLNNFKNTPLWEFFQWSFFIYPFQILEKNFLNYITKKIDSYFWNKNIFSQDKYLSPIKNSNYVNFFSQKYEFFSYLKFKEILEEIFFEKFWKDLRKKFLDLEKRFLLSENDFKKILSDEKNFLADKNNFEKFLKNFHWDYWELENFSEENKKNLKKIFYKHKIIRFEDELSEILKNNFSKNLKQFWFLEYKINENLTFKYIFWDKIKPNDEKIKFLEDDFSDILWKNFKNNSKKLTPDISLEINYKKNINWKLTNFSKKIFFDVKFSSFKDFDLNLDYPNPKYFKSDLHKYRKIWYKNKKNIENNKNFKSKAEKIFLIYPWNISEKNFEEFKKLNHLVEKSYNMILIPIYQWFWEKKFLREYLKEKIFWEIKNLMK